MPVWVKGNVESGIFILTCHGGPGGTSGWEFPISKGFKTLEEKYAFVYWDQRISGSSQGEASVDDLTIDLHIEDLEKLALLIKDNYDPEAYFLLGHSWGGVLTGGYLGRGDNQHFFDGWIDMDGSIQDEFETQAKFDWIMDHIDEFYDNDPEFYQYIIDWYEENPNPVENDWQPYTYAGSMNGYVYDWEKSQEENPTPYKELVLGSPFSFAYYFTQYADVPWMNGYDVTEEVQNIEIPALLLWGKEDGAVPATVAEFTYSLLATPEEDKEVVLIEQCAHAPHVDTPEAFDLHVTNFVERYK